MVKHDQRSAKLFHVTSTNKTTSRHPLIVMTKAGPAVYIWCTQCTYIGRLMSQRGKILMSLTKMFPCSKKYENLGRYSSTYIVVHRLFAPDIFLVPMELWGLSHWNCASANFGGLYVPILGSALKSENINVYNSQRSFFWALKIWILKNTREVTF